MSKKTIEEQSKEDVAKKVITPKRRYFVPSVRRTVEAENVAEVAKQVTEKKEDGDE